MRRRDRVVVARSGAEETAGCRLEWTGFAGCGLSLVVLRRVNFAAGDECGEHARGEDRRRSHLVEIAIDEDEVCVVTGNELALVLLGELGVGRALRVGMERLAAR